LAKIEELKQQIADLIEERKRLEEEEAERRRLAELENANKPVAQIIQEEAAVYKPIKGDAVDELMAEYMNRMGLHVPLVRLDEKASGEYRRYLFGTKKIQAKILNQKLVIKVGGGYMGIQEFLETYGQSELDKMAALAAKGKVGFGN